jgi:hypothetical protein
MPFSSRPAIDAAAAAAPIVALTPSALRCVGAHVIGPQRHQPPAAQVVPERDRANELDTRPFSRSPTRVRPGPWRTPGALW